MRICVSPAVGRAKIHDREALAQLGGNPGFLCPTEGRNETRIAAKLARRVHPQRSPCLHVELLTRPDPPSKLKANPR